MRTSMMARGGRALVVLSLLGGSFVAVQALWSSPAAAPPVTPTAYVSNRATSGVTPINTSSNSVGGTIGVGNFPGELAIAPDAQTAYVAYRTAVSAIATSSNTVSNINLPAGSVPAGIAITPNGQTAYVASATNAVIPINLSTSTPGAAIALPAGTNPAGIAITPNGQTAYVVGTNVVIPINLGNGSLGASIGFPAGTGTSAIAVNPNGQFAYVVGRGSSTLTPINLSNNSLLPPVTMPAGTGPNNIAITPNGQEAYLVGGNVTPPYGLSITPINLANLPSSATPIQLDRLHRGQDRRPAAPCISFGGIAIVPTGNEAFVTDSCLNDTFAVSLSALTSPTVINAGPQPWGVAITPDQAPTAAFSATPAPPGSPTSFDASASSSPVGAIASYAWDFGDGKTQSTSSPTISHTYAAAGTFTVTLTVTNTQGTSTTQTFTGQTVSNNGGPSAQVSHGVPVSSPGAPPPPPVAPPPPPTKPGGPAPIPVPPNVTTPTLLISPAVGPPGTIVTVEGVDFPANTAVTVGWSTQTGSVQVTSTAGGLFLTQMFILTPDVLGPRAAQAAGYPTAQAQFLVVPGTSQPGGGGPELLFRDEST